MYLYKFINPFKTYLDKNAVYNFINNMIKESKHCSEVTEKHFNKHLVMTKEVKGDFKNSIKCWICYSDYVENDVKKRPLSYYWLYSNKTFLIGLSS